jgi:hypothetical protein
VLEYSEHLAREIYEVIHQDAVRPQGERPKKNAEIVSVFAGDTATKIGMTARTVRKQNETTCTSAARIGTSTSLLTAGAFGNHLERTRTQLRRC